MPLTLPILALLAGLAVAALGVVVTASANGRTDETVLARRTDVGVAVVLVGIVALLMGLGGTAFTVLSLH